VLGVVSNPNRLHTAICLCKITFNIILSCLVLSNCLFPLRFSTFLISCLLCCWILDLSALGIIFFVCVSEQPNSGQGRLVVEVARSHTHTHTHAHTHESVGFLWTGDQPVSDNTQRSKEPDIHALGGIRTRVPSNRAVAEPHGHLDGCTKTISD
jgi:hypothetical protein